MFGWRKRIGYITPTVMEVVPYEFYRFAPEGVGLVGVTCNIDDWGPEEFEKGARPGQDDGRLSRLARRRFHHPRRRSAGRQARQGFRGNHRPGDRGGSEGSRHHRGPRRHGGTAPRRRAPRRDRFALSEGAGRGDGGLSHRARLRDSAGRGLGHRLQGAAKYRARGDLSICRGRARPRQGLRGALFARNGRPRRSWTCWRKTAACRWSPIPTPISSPHSSGSGCAIRFAATAGCSPRSPRRLDDRAGKRDLAAAGRSRRARRLLAVMLPAAPAQPIRSPISTAARPSS